MITQKWPTLTICYPSHKWEPSSQVLRSYPLDDHPRHWWTMVGLQRTFFVGYWPVSCTDMLVVNGWTSYPNSNLVIIVTIIFRGLPFINCFSIQWQTLHNGSWDRPAWTGAGSARRAFRRLRRFEWRADGPRLWGLAPARWTTVEDGWSWWRLVKAEVGWLTIWLLMLDNKQQWLEWGWFMVKNGWSWWRLMYFTTACWEWENFYVGNPAVFSAQIITGFPGDGDVEAGCWFLIYG